MRLSAHNNLYWCDNGLFNASANMLNRRGCKDSADE